MSPTRMGCVGNAADTEEMKERRRTTGRMFMR
jgi:hypothetical protein